MLCYTHCLLKVRTTIDETQRIGFAKSANSRRFGAGILAHCPRVVLVVLRESGAPRRVRQSATAGIKLTHVLPERLKAARRFYLSERALCVMG